MIHHGRTKILISPLIFKIIKTYEVSKNSSFSNVCADIKYNFL